MWAWYWQSPTTPTLFIITVLLLELIIITAQLLELPPLFLFTLAIIASISVDAVIILFVDDILI